MSESIVTVNLTRLMQVYIEYLISAAYSVIHLWPTTMNVGIVDQLCDILSAPQVQRTLAGNM